MGKRNRRREGGEGEELEVEWNRMGGERREIEERGWNMRKGGYGVQE